MTLARRMFATTAAGVVSLLVISAAALWGLGGLGRDLDVALGEYATLRQIYEIGLHVATARTMLTAPQADDRRLLAQLNSAVNYLSLFMAGGEPTASSAEPSTLRSSPAGAAALQGLRQMIADIEQARAGRAPPPDRADQIMAVNAVLNQLAHLANETRQVITDTQEAADARRRTAMTVVAAVSAVIVLGAVIVSAWQYRSVMTPLRRLRRGVRSIAAGQFADRLDESGDREFVALATDFNRMAGELDSLYRQLEEKVAIKSRELVRSERLASVGYLAAGVAHEINNPLGIMSGHAELALKRLDKGADPSQRPQALDPAVAEAAKALRIICDEAFRCKQIIEKLLSLTRPGGDRKQRVSLVDVARDVAALVGGLKRYQDRTVELALDAADVLAVVGNETELKQVLLNLTINALDAVAPGAGRVVIAVRRRGERVIVTVRDNGRGMPADMLDRVFEPFFTQKRGVSESGTGLGLSISHAIVTEHGGHIRAQSAGPGQGSQFTVDLPAAD